MKNKFYTITALLFFIVLAGCRRGSSASDYMLRRMLRIYFVDSVTNKQLIGRNGEPYFADSINIFEYNYNNVLENTGGIGLDTSGKFGCVFFYYYSFASKEDDFKVVSLNHAYYIQLSPSDTDTILVKKQPFSDVYIYWNTHQVAIIPEMTKNFPDTITIKK